MVETAVVHQSRWGFHPCSHADYLLFKELHWLAFLDMKATRKWQRWHARLPKNRSTKEPAKPSGTTRAMYSDILFEYRNIKVPCDGPEKVIPIGLEYDWRDAVRIFRGIYGEGMTGKIPGPPPHRVS